MKKQARKKKLKKREERKEEERKKKEKKEKKKKLEIARDFLPRIISLLCFLGFWKMLLI
jgi:membrane protein insertase Oxa1/YidC/SpoIIIJ